MLGRGDWKKLEDAINAVVVPMGQRIRDLEDKVAVLQGATPEDKEVAPVELEKAKTSQERAEAKKS